MSHVILPPRKTLWAAELPRAGWAVVQLALAQPRLRTVPPGDGRPVMLLPGLFNSDRSNFALRGFLSRLGYRTVGWSLGRNFGARTVGADGDRLFARIAAFAEETGEPVTLIGVSLGGMLARLAAHRRPTAVREVITIASPYAGHPRATNVWRAFEFVTGERVDDAIVADRLAELARPLPVPATALWSASDGLVAGAICRGDDCPAVEIRSSHMGVQLRPEVLLRVAEILAVSR